MGESWYNPDASMSSILNMDKASVSDLNEFHPSRLNSYHMNKTSEGFDKFVEFMEATYVFDRVPKKVEERFYEGKEIVKELIKKLRKGKTSVFVDEDEWESI